MVMSVELKYQSNITLFGLILSYCPNYNHLLALQKQFVGKFLTWKSGENAHFLQ